MTPKQINEVCAKAMGWKRGGVPGINDLTFDPYHSIADAWRLVEYVQNNKPADCWMSFVDKDWAVDFGENSFSVHDTAPAAICLAFLEWAKARKDTK